MRRMIDEPGPSVGGCVSQVRTAAHALSFDMGLWTQDGLRYVVIGDAGRADIETLSPLTRASR